MKTSMEKERERAAEGPNLLFWLPRKRSRPWSLPDPETLCQWQRNAWRLAMLRMHISQQTYTIHFKFDFLGSGAGVRLYSTRHRFETSIFGNRVYYRSRSNRRYFWAQNSQPHGAADETRLSIDSLIRSHQNPESILKISPDPS